jgi:hypothetical protein
MCDYFSDLRSFHQPLPDRVRVNLKHPGRGAHAQAFGHACQHTDDQLDRHPFAMKNGAVRLEEISVTRATIPLPPWTTTGMTMRAQVPQSQPAAIVTARMETEMPRGVNHTRTLVGRWHPIGSQWRLRLGMARVVCTRGTIRSLSMTLEGFRFVGPLTLDLKRHRASITASANFGHSASPDNVTYWHIMALQ